MPLIYNVSELKQRRRTLRKLSTPAQIMLWDQLRNRQLQGHEFRRQYSIGSYIVDFYCPKLRLAIEIDGEIHRTVEAEQYDRVRQKSIEALGIRLTRFHNEDIQEDLDSVMVRILAVALDLRPLDYGLESSRLKKKVN